MTTEFNIRSHALLMEAIVIDDEDERRSFVMEACNGDTVMRRKMQSLLNALTGATDFLQSPAAVIPETLAPPEQIGLYRIERTLGTGGMATVFEAIQSDPHRRVALKVMRTGLAHTSSVERFRFETAVLAKLRHPCIAQIYEAGTFEETNGTATPYFAMELVPDARTLTVYAEQSSISTKERLKLFCSVCEAIQHGHQLGVIHRDLKPSNILVDPSGNVKVIDFGIARSSNGETEGITAQEDLGKLLGTLNYISPEQCGGGTGPVDVRSDIYSLGAVLYELLCGHLPHDLTDAHTAEAVRIVQCDDPPRPSRLVPALRGDVETIILTALMKDRDRRYQSVSELAADIRRHLAHEPISARSASSIYQLRKFVRRNRAVVWGTVAVTLALIAGLITTTQQAIQADRARLAAESRQQELERVVDFQRSEISGIDVPEMGDLLRQSFSEQLDLNENVSSADTNLNSINFTSLAMRVIQQSVLDRSYNSINAQFGNEPALRAELLHTLATTMHRLGDIDGALRVITECYDLRRNTLGPTHPDTLTTRGMLGVVLGATGSYDEALRQLEETYRLQTEILGAEHPATLRTANSFGGILRYQGRLEEANEVWEQTYSLRDRTLGTDHNDTLVSLNNLGVIRAVRGNLRGAEHAWRELLDRRRRVLGEDNPQYASSLTNLGLVLIELGEPTEAQDLLERALAAKRQLFGDAHPSTISTMGSLAVLMMENGDLALAEPLLQECLDRRISTFGPDHPTTLLTRSDMAVLRDTKDPSSQSLQEQADVLAKQEELLGETHPDTLRSMDRYTTMLLAHGQLDEAERRARRTLDLMSDTTDTNSAVMAGPLVTLARVLLAKEHFQESEQLLVDAYESFTSALGEDTPRARPIAQELAQLYEEWAIVDPSENHTASAARWKRIASE